MNFAKPFRLVAALLALFAAAAKTFSASTNDADAAYVFATFREPQQDGLCLAYSYDGFHWTNLPGLFAPAEAGGGVMRDPSLLRAPDGTYHLVWTSAWRGDLGFGHASSKDLLHWSKQQFVPAMTNEPTACNTWSPELFFDAKGNQFVIIWASTIPGRFPDHLEPSTNNHRLFVTTTADFKSFSPTKVFFDPDFSVIDPQILQDGERFILLFKDNTRPQRNLRVAFGDSPLGSWRDVSTNLTAKFTEGPCALKVGDDWLIYYEAYEAKHYAALRTRDFKSFSDATGEMLFPPGLKHGTALRVPRADLERLLTTEVDYSRSIGKRADDIVAALTLTNAVVGGKVHDVAVAQYRALKDWHMANDGKLKAADTNRVAETRASLKVLHEKFLSDLAAAGLAPEQVDAVKDKMTYNKVAVTFAAYGEIISGLTGLEKARVMELLKDAREEAMDGGSSNEKDVIFKRYKGKINNYLSEQGHDVKQDYKVWGEKQKTKSSAATNQPPAAVEN